MSIRNILILSLCAVSLGGCASLDKAATKLGVNFWSQKAEKAPCKPLASLNEDIDIHCIGVPLEKPSKDERLKLRGRYTVENGIILSPIQVAP